MTLNKEGKIVNAALEAINWAKSTSESAPPHDPEELLARSLVFALKSQFPALKDAILRNTIIDTVYFEAKVHAITEGLERHGKKARKKLKGNAGQKSPSSSSQPL